MATVVRASDDAEWVLERAGRFLAGDPVLHNVILTLLHGRAVHPEPGRYWVVEAGGAAAGVVFQSPLDFPATITPMAADLVSAAVDAIVDQGVRLPGVNGEAGTTARFAGHWTERTKSSARPVMGQRLYEVEAVVAPRPAAGASRVATAGESDVLVEWFRAFQAEVGEPGHDPTPVVERRLSAGQLWMWDDGGAVSMTGVSEPVGGVSRVGPVYTPPDRRGRGYASGLVADVSSAVLARGDRCMLYTDLGNPTSNSVYRALGYRAVAEALRYEFDGGPV